MDNNNYDDLQKQKLNQAQNQVMAMLQTNSQPTAVDPDTQAKMQALQKLKTANTMQPPAPTADPMTEAADQTQQLAAAPAASASQNLTPEQQLAKLKQILGQ